MTGCELDNDARRRWLRLARGTCLAGREPEVRRALAGLVSVTALIPGVF